MSDANVEQVVPFLTVSGMERSFEYYVSKPGFTMKQQWAVDGKPGWRWLELGGVALMLQARRHSFAPVGKAGEGVSPCFQCEEAMAIHHEANSGGIGWSEPFVGNGMWVTILTDPDGYRLGFESRTDTPEETGLWEVGG